MISNKLYNILKYLALIGLPALGTFWMVVGALWGAPHTDEVVKTIVALGALLGALLVLSNAKYNASDARFDGTLIVDETAPQFDNEVRQLDLKDPVNNASANGEVRLRVRTIK